LSIKKKAKPKTKNATPPTDALRIALFQLP